MSVIRENIDLKIRLHTVGNYKMPVMHSHNAYEIYILEEGDRTYIVEDKLLYLKPRDVLLIKKDAIHCTVGGKYISSMIEFSEEYLCKFFSEYSIARVTECFEKNIIRVRESDFPVLLSLVEKLYENNDDFMSFVQLISVLENNMLRKTYGLQSRSPKVADIVDYISENYKNIDSLDMIAEKFYMSKGYLCHFFKEYTDTSIIKYINLLKVHSPMELLSNENLTMTEVAEKSGFSSLAYFSKTFKSITGLSPLNYRKTL